MTDVQILELAKECNLIQWKNLPSGEVDPSPVSVSGVKKFAHLLLAQFGLIDSAGQLPTFFRDESVYVHSAKNNATVIEQTKYREGDKWYWGNVWVRFSDGSETCWSTWLLSKND